MCTIQPVQAQSTAGDMHQAIQLGLKGKYDEALNLINQIIGKEPQNVFAHNNLGMIYAMMKNPELAITAYETALKLKPDFAMPENNLGHLYKEMGKYDLAETHLKNAVRLFPGMETAHGGLGEVYQLQLRYDDAIEHFKKATQLRPEQVSFHQRLAECYQAKQMTAEAQKELDLLKKMAPQ
jgi:tetratricopeptide (TPR) repeat protein